MDGCMFLNKGPTKMCLAKQNKKDGWGGGKRYFVMRLERDVELGKGQYPSFTEISTASGTSILRQECKFKPRHLVLMMSYPVVVSVSCESLL